MSRVRVELSVDPAAWGREHAKLVGPDDLEALEDALAVGGPEPVGFVLEVEESSLDELPEVWSVDRIQRPVGRPFDG